VSRRGVAHELVVEETNLPLIHEGDRHLPWPTCPFLHETELDEVGDPVLGDDVRHWGLPDHGDLDMVARRRHHASPARACRTASLTRLPLARSPAALSATGMNLPISFGLLAPTLATASRTNAVNSSSLISFGMYRLSTSSCAVSRSTRSTPPAARYCSIESSRRLDCVLRTSISSVGVNAERWSISAFLSAANVKRSVSRAVTSPAFI